MEIKFYKTRKKITTVALTASLSVATLTGCNQNDFVESAGSINIEKNMKPEDAFYTVDMLEDKITVNWTRKFENIWGTSYILPDGTKWEKDGFQYDAYSVKDNCLEIILCRLQNNFSNEVVVYTDKDMIEHVYYQYKLIKKTDTRTGESLDIKEDSYASLDYEHALLGNETSKKKIKRDN
ncbi:MAG: hypothetical protein PHN72_06910 [Bacilli bacterium]|nr:hypothetical protein [Bacilli bacterium]